jgi:predicted Zn-dependent peptidase
MKKTFIYFLALLPIVSMAQVDRTKAPKPAAAPVIKIGQPATIVLPNGLKVFVVQNSKLPRVTASLTIDTDGIIEGEKTGISQMAGSLMRRGTATLTKEKLDEEIDFLGASVNTSAFSASASSLKNNFSRVFALMSEVVLRPSLPSSELEKIRKQQLSGLQAAKDDPNSIADNVANRLVYGKNHPYGDIETEQTLNNVKLDDIKRFFATHWIPNNAYLVFVGDITRDEAKALAIKHFSGWRRGTAVKPTFPTPQPPAKTYVAIVDRPASVQSVITFITPVSLKPGAPEAIPASVMNNILGVGSSGRLFQNLREKHGFTYGAYSNLKSDRLIGAFSAEASVRNEKTDSAIGEFLGEFKAISTKATPDSDVVNMKNFLSGQFARSLENPATIANFALNIARYNLPADYYQNYLKNLGTVNPRIVQTIAAKYVNPNQMHIIVVGNAKQIAPGLEKYGEVKYFDVYGNETAAPAAAKKIDAGVSAESVMQKAIAAYGTPEAVSAVKDIDLAGEANVMGNTLQLRQKAVLPGAYSFVISAGPMVIQKKLVKDGKYSLSEQGQDKEADAEDKEEMDEEGAFFSESFMMKKGGYKFDATGIEQVNGKDAYVVVVKTPAGRNFTNYYDVASGLKVRSEQEEDAGPAGKVKINMYYSDYKPFNGVQVPTTMVLDQGPLKIEMTFKEVKINSGLKAEDIK